MSEILEEIAPQARIGVLSGPNLAREIAEHALTATVVASEDDEFRLLEARRQCLLDQADLPGQRLQPAEGAEGLGLGVDALLEGGGDALVGAGDGVGHGGAVSDERRRGW